VARCEHCGGDEHLDVRGGQHPAYFAIMGAAALGDGVEVVLGSGLGVLSVPGAQLVQVIDDQDGWTAGHRELGQHLVDHGLAVELGRRGQGLAPSQNSRASRWPGRTAMRAIR
jgi:hypothetical protein